MTDKPPDTDTSPDRFERELLEGLHHIREAFGWANLNRDGIVIELPDERTGMEFSHWIASSKRLGNFGAYSPAARRYSNEIEVMGFKFRWPMRRVA